MDNNLYLEHHGILGQKWGIRRYQNPDGTLTPEGKEKLSEYRRKERKYSKMAFSERIESRSFQRLSKEKQKKEIADHAKELKAISSMSYDDMKREGRIRIASGAAEMGILMSVSAIIDGASIAYNANKYGMAVKTFAKEVTSDPSWRHWTGVSVAAAAGMSVFDSADRNPYRSMAGAFVKKDRIRRANNADHKN